MTEEDEYKDRNIPSNIASIDDSTQIFADADAIRRFLEKYAVRYEEEKALGAPADQFHFIAYFKNEQGEEKKIYPFFSFEWPAVFMRKRGDDMEAAFLLARAIEAELPHLDGKLMFANEYGMLSHFDFGLSDHELYERIALEGDSIDYDLMLKMDLISPEDIPKKR